MTADATTRFVILAARRTGSNMLCTLLDAHPEVLCHHELFNPRGVFVALDLRGRAPLGELEARDADRRAFLERVWATRLGHRCVGFKLTIGQVPEVIRALVADRGVAKIVLRRRNLLEAFVSEQIAERLDQWEVYDRAELSVERPRVHVEPEHLLAHVARVEAFYAGLREGLRSFPLDDHHLGFAWLAVSLSGALEPSAQGWLLAAAEVVVVAAWRSRASSNR